MRRLRTTLILAAALAGLLLYAFWVEQPRERRRLQTEAQAKRLVAFEVADAVGLTIRTPQGEVTLDRAEGGPPASGGEAGWQVSRPLRTRADQQAVTTVLDRLREAVIARVVEEHAADLAPFGLDRPEVQVTVRLAGKPNDREARLDLGATGPMESTLFVRKDAETRVLLADLGLKQAVSKTLEDLRDKSVVRFDPERVGSLRLEYRDRRFGLTRDGETWRLTAPMTAPADRNEVGGLLATLRGLTAEGFVDEGKTAERARLSTPRLTVRLGLPDGDRTVVFYPAPQQPTAKPPTAAPHVTKVYAVTSDPEDPLFLVSDEVLRRFDKTVFDLRDKTVLTLTRSAVKEVTVRATTGQWTLTAKDGGWVVDGAKRAKTSTVTRLLDRLETLRVARFLDEGIPEQSLAAKGLVPPRIEVEFTGPGQTRLALLAFGREERGLVYAKVTDSKGGARFLMLAREAAEGIPQRDEVLEDTGGP